MRIKEIQLGLPAQVGTQLLIRVMPFDTEATTCELYYMVSTDSGSQLADGNINLNEDEFANWGEDNTYLEDLVLNKLGLERHDIIPTDSE